MNLDSRWYRVISYVAVGAVTTIINIVSFWIFTIPIHLDYRVATTIAWVFSVLFAYAANKIIVFRSRTKTKKETVREFLFFVGFRLLSYAMDLLAMILFISGFHMNGLIAKALANVLVLVANYVFSRVFVFRKNTKEALINGDDKQ